MIAMLVPSKASSLACVLMWAPRHPAWRNHGVVMGYCDTSQNAEQRATDLVSKLNLAEKVSSL